MKNGANNRRFCFHQKDIKSTLQVWNPAFCFLSFFFILYSSTSLEEWYLTGAGFYVLKIRTSGSSLNLPLVLSDHLTKIVDLHSKMKDAQTTKCSVFITSSLVDEFHIFLHNDS